MTGFIYFIGCGEFVKVGFAAAPRARMEELQTGSPYPLKMLSAYPGQIADEKAVHRRLNEFHHRGEWYINNSAIGGMIERSREAGHWAPLDERTLRDAELLIGISRHSLCPELFADCFKPGNATVPGQKLADWLKKTRTRRYQFAARIGVPASVVSDYCNGRYSPSPKVAVAIIRETLGEVTANDFLSIARDVAA